MKHWIEAMRLRTLPLSLSSVLVGSALVADRDKGFFPILGLAVLTTILLQILSNLANDYGDSQNGADNEGRVGPRRAVQAGLITKKEMRNAIILNAVLALVSGLLLVYVAFNGRSGMALPLLFIVLGLGAIAAAIKYTAGKNPYGYRGMGDLFVLLFFGLIGVAGTYFLHAGDISWDVFLPATTIGCLSTAVLNLNNLRDHVNDEASGKRTLVVMMGFERAKIYHTLLFTGGWLSLLSYLIFFSHTPWMWISMAALPLHLVHLKKVFSTQDPQQLDPELKKIALSTFGISLLLFVAAML
ncbi:1,4-dihydroxy-2-naphthoate polyprenyltransferase [Sanyastnella coralliicola]|uniref:1,4-dihydroxy-2-naphthoate polyprenyltransferase n=1 Tax=Sanyastnella coralliicola TaxID=3069118 RepID=UPI0027B90285|nr:1,4-dihydroxy-2-naphthoate polyprenyltransferase [Longitalea sp. SCSIO 12813]